MSAKEYAREQILHAYTTAPLCEADDTAQLVIWRAATDEGLDPESEKELYDYARALRNHIKKVSA